MNKLQLIEAAKVGGVNWVQALIECGGNLEQKDYYGWTAYNWTSIYGDAEIFRIFLESGADTVNSGGGFRVPYQIVGVVKWVTAVTQKNIKGVADVF
ncbi:ankyrin repeat domain-containing protein [Methylobacter sp. S3L5C]|uniref:ankyrin repeat domain-containing protein n=1 Tax=Methylobacter sp. S3L5C TaxID=2839024 RepID=UPI001FAC7342|nr:ankyrin repeat domain-containing protein [Methylobacter sp. S3L5C]UOA09652.1 ankyrin repeat domain-containing protein [Methylobacter sp. S3L5C]